MIYKSEVLKELMFRGFIYQCTDSEALDDLLLNQKVPVYIGFDVTADSLHAGHLTQIALLRIFQKHGHTPIILLGGGTTKIGDPTWKNEMRPLLSNEQLQKNIDGVKQSLSWLINLDKPNKAIVANNDDWLSSLNYIDFLRDFGVYFSVNKMVNMETFKQRLNDAQNLSFLEFNYPLLQSFDFLELHKRLKCIVQLGGSDQWGNITSGVDLVRRITGTTVYGLTSPLLTTADGKKMGKTVSGAVWLNKEKLNSYDFWQYWRNVSDEDVINLVKRLTDADENMVKEFARLKFEELNQAKIFLADSITELCRGQAELDAVHTLLKGGTAAISSKSEIVFKKSEIVGQKSIVHISVEVGAIKSNSEAKRLITSGGLYVNSEQVADVSALIQEDHIIDGHIKIGVGKKKLVIVKVV